MDILRLTHPETPGADVCSHDRRQGVPVHIRAEHEIVYAHRNYRRVCRHCGQEPLGMGGCSCSAPIDILAERKADGATVRVEFL